LIFAVIFVLEISFKVISSSLYTLEHQIFIKLTSHNIDNKHNSGVLTTDQHKLIVKNLIMASITSSGQSDFFYFFTVALNIPCLIFLIILFIRNFIGSITNVTTFEVEGENQACSICSSF
jgi:hypothetical protein